MPVMSGTALNKRHDHDGHMVSKVVGVDKAYVPCPTNIAPRMAATLDVYPRAGRNDDPDLVVRRGSPTQI